MEKAIKKVSLLTFNNAQSYGAVLQTYALVKALEKLNLNVEIIDFKSPFLSPIPTGIWTLKTYYNFRIFKQKNVFRKFRKKHLNNKTKTFYSVNSLFKYHFNSDYYIVGSDQVWNPDITKKYVLNYFFDFVEGKKISYAASFGKEEWNYSDDFNRKIGNLLDEFNALSVRELSGKSILKDIFGVNSDVVLDPTLLFADFSELLPKYAERNQIAAFQVNLNNEFLNVVDSIQKDLKLPAYLIDSTIKYKNLTPLPFPSVNEWLKYIAESSLIITDSFHGVAFCLIYKKNFIVLKSNIRRFCRIENLLEYFELTDRIVDSETNFSQIIELLSSSIDYSSVASLLAAKQIESYRFLTESLNSEL